jgi:hypothetical protein
VIEHDDRAEVSVRVEARNSCASKLIDSWRALAASLAAWGSLASTRSELKSPGSAPDHLRELEHRALAARHVPLSPKASNGSP